ncbi:diaminopimelate epimerase [Flavobacterium psychrophilum]|uniref:Diaminopimelate epimerase n=1 Tax=Flavobacterium psychrophilum (strain ATCC 49511 / DSM 21280 / CIP 103535 / JIP02/86) TaxID=402612 RepID=DAPF_FLAPJ|nr:diaminopimelate epimerase [Flavobacterium psychrophilum]A6GYX5.1 RecName: Full=Diaminopimelate epimerase; Short=DAP epimerase; AltName: Full=PLP-independent amino acid racemase [Flavobacterium psychrophilum JIP02/86]AIG30007.1 diaminopimelate epimerase [Flavobacterium psychrophilum]AIG32283.1 diaminopimelate epimerase [Flavobacterium psychrophilum]AIG34441.1 diaminopimelate epimerase [Flavobacterium psychrophilum]AIG36801.1 diaminopimelate epimerase [Flavobacterium psychrophilum]AIG39065.1
MKLYKYQGTGNDFIMIDNRLQIFPKQNTALIQKLCDRRFGIGADGLILLENDQSTDFKMVYYNSDGNQSTMCGNGGRCLVAFAKKLNIIKNKTTFIAIDGLHHATINENDIISLQMKNVEEVNIHDNYVFLNTGSPHHVQFADNLSNFDVKNEGAKIRYSDLYGQAGSNINFVHQTSPTQFSIRTYERGVEDETLSCGTGATATAIAMKATGKTNSNNITINVQGGKLEVSFNQENSIFTNIFLKGPAEFVFETTI